VFASQFAEREMHQAVDHQEYLDGESNSDSFNYEILQK
jgi:hypothetical protein